MVIGGFEHTVLFSLAVGSYDGIGGFRFTMVGEDDTRTDMPTFQASIVCEHDINLAVVGTFDRLLQALTNPNQFHVTWFAVHTLVFHLWGVRKGNLSYYGFQASQHCFHCIPPMRG